MKRSLQWESPAELNAFRILDADPLVSHFSEQPLVVEYLLDGVEHDHYPDIKVIVDGVKELWEVKTRADAAHPDVARRTAVMTAGLPTFGYRYRVVFAEDLKAMPRLSNALTLLSHGRFEIPLTERERLRRLLLDVGELRWGDVLAGSLGQAGKRHVCRLALEGFLGVDMSVPLGSDTLFRGVAR